MADNLTVRFDTSEWENFFDRLASTKLRESLARRMGVSIGVVFRDEAIRRAPDGPQNHAPSTPRANWGKLKESIYLALKDDSTEIRIHYGVRWNDKKAPQGHLLEFGYKQPYVVYKDKDGNFHTLANKKGEGVLREGGPKQYGPWPFLGPAYDAMYQVAMKAGIERGRMEVPELLLNGQAVPDGV